MILYQLRCAHDHDFEAWFRSGDSFDEQVDMGEVECPFCGETRVAKAMMAPNVAKKDSAPPFKEVDLRDLEKAPATASSDNDEARAQVLAHQILRAVDKLRTHVEDNFDYVGDDFAEEARKIHAGTAEDRGIYGDASDKEAIELEDEGIEYVRMPVQPRRDS